MKGSGVEDTVEVSWGLIVCAFSRRRGLEVELKEELEADILVASDICRLMIFFSASLFELDKNCFSLYALDIWPLVFPLHHVNKIE